MNLDEWLIEKKIPCKDFAQILGVSIPTLVRIREGKLPSIVNVIFEIEKRTSGEVTLKDLLKNSGRKNNKKSKSGNENKDSN